MFCNKCGKEIADGAKFCPSCGATQGSAPVVPQPYAQAPQPPPQQKEWTTALLLCFFLGGLGAHRFYTGHTAIGIVQLLTFGGCGIWALIDLIIILCGSFKDSNGLPLKR